MLTRLGPRRWWETAPHSSSARHSQRAARLAVAAEVEESDTGIVVFSATEATAPFALAILFAVVVLVALEIPQVNSELR